jgi:YHS domain-containing protein
MKRRNGVLTVIAMIVFSLSIAGAMAQGCCGSKGGKKSAATIVNGKKSCAAEAKLPECQKNDFNKNCSKAGKKGCSDKCKADKKKCSAKCKAANKECTAECKAAKKKCSAECKTGKGCTVKCKTGKKECTVGCKAAKRVKSCPSCKAKMLVQQTKCPVMGGKVNKNISVDHNGKRIYLCCNGCIDTFNKSPEKYMKKFQKDGVKLEKIEKPE